MRNKHSAVRKLTAVALCCLLYVGGFGATSSRAQTPRGVKGGARGAQSKAPAQTAASSPAAGKSQPAPEARALTLARLNKVRGPVALKKISPDLQDFLSAPGNARKHVRVICQLNAPPGREIEQIYARPGVSVSYSFANSIDLVATMPAAVVLELSAQKELDYISLDREVRTLGHVS
ncbi:MAG TPA: hypothetical protein VGA87_11420, partial [Pyrinomonadaceae bacterium]